jgi:hypothetical protein
LDFFCWHKKGSTPIQEAAFGEYDGLAKAPIKQENK